MIKAAITTYRRILIIIDEEIKKIIDDVINRVTAIRIYYWGPACGHLKQQHRRSKKNGYKAVDT
jgi:hypothetical protein